MSIGKKITSTFGKIAMITTTVIVISTISVGLIISSIASTEIKREALLGQAVSLELIDKMIIEGNLRTAEELESNFKDIQFEESSYIYALGMDGMMFYHPKEDLIGMSFVGEDVYESIKLKTEARGTFEYVYKGTPKLASYIITEGYYLILTIDKSELFAIEILLREITLIAFSVLAILLSIVITLLFMGSTRKVTNEIGNLSKNSKNGDLTNIISTKAVFKKTNEEDRFFNILVDVITLSKKLKSFFTNLQGRISVLYEGFGELSVNITETSAAINEITASVESTTKQVVEQKQQLDKIEEGTGEISDRVNVMSDSIENQSANIEESSSAIEQLVANIQSITTHNNNSTEKMKSLIKISSVGKELQSSLNTLITKVESKLVELDSANETLNDLSASTNILSLNAAIEAAHAGDAGKGFAVVAEEVRKLAEQSAVESDVVKQSVTEIKAMVKEVVSASEESAIAYNKIEEEVEAVSNLSREIQMSLTEQSAGSSQILTALVEMKESTSSVKSDFSNVSNVNDIIKTEVEQIMQITNVMGPSFEEIKIGIKEINNSATIMNDLSQSTKEILEQVEEDASYFKV